jgi:hypothetical protein
MPVVRSCVFDVSGEIVPAFIDRALMEYLNQFFPDLKREVSGRIQHIGKISFFHGSYSLLLPLKKYHAAGVITTKKGALRAGQHDSHKGNDIFVCHQKKRAFFVFYSYIKSIPCHQGVLI